MLPQRVGAECTQVETDGEFAHAHYNLAEHHICLADKIYFWFRTPVVKVNGLIFSAQDIAQTSTFPSCPLETNLCSVPLVPLRQFFVRLGVLTEVLMKMTHVRFLSLCHQHSGFWQFVSLIILDPEIRISQHLQIRRPTATWTRSITKVFKLF